MLKQFFHRSVYDRLQLIVCLKFVGVFYERITSAYKNLGKRCASLTKEQPELSRVVDH